VTVASPGHRGRNVDGVLKHIGRIEAFRTGFLHAPVINDVVGDVRMTLEAVRVKRITLNIDLAEARRSDRCGDWLAADGRTAILLTRLMP
jgi:hypothetical protein